MNEKDRRIVVKRVKKNIQDTETLKLKTNELEQLSQNEIIIKYLELKQEVITLKNRIKGFNGDTEEMIKLEFNWAFASPHLEKYLGRCEHINNIWIYCGSYEIYQDDYSEHDRECRVKSETDCCFKYNKYACLECGKIIKTSNWQEFEESHFVLKDINITNAYEYRYHFYQLLYRHTIDKSKELIIKEFNKKSKKLSRKPNKN